MKTLSEILFEKFKTPPPQITDYKLNSAILKTKAFPALHRQLKKVKRNV